MSGFDFSSYALAAVQLTNILLSGYVLAMLLSSRHPNQKIMFSRSARILISATALLLVAELIKVFSILPQNLSEFVLSLSILVFLAMVVLAIREMGKELSAHHHIAHRKNRHHTIRDVE